MEAGVNQIIVACSPEGRRCRRLHLGYHDVEERRAAGRETHHPVRKKKKCED